MGAGKLIGVLSWFRKGKPNESGGQIETERISKLDSETAKLPKPWPAPDLSPDDIARIGPDRVVNRLGEGGMGRVHRGPFVVPTPPRLILRPQSAHLYRRGSRQRPA